MSDDDRASHVIKIKLSNWIRFLQRAVHHPRRSPSVRDHLETRSFLEQQVSCRSPKIRKIFIQMKTLKFLLTLNDRHGDIYLSLLYSDHPIIIRGELGSLFITIFSLLEVFVSQVCRPRGHCPAYRWRRQNWHTSTLRVGYCAY